MQAYLYGNASSTYGTATYSSVTGLVSSSLSSAADAYLYLTLERPNYEGLDIVLKANSSFISLPLRGGQVYVNANTASNWTFEPATSTRRLIKSIVIPEAGIEVASLSTVASKYTPIFSKIPATLRDFVRFMPEAIIEADDVNENFGLALDVINEDSTSERLIRPQYLRLGSSHISSLSVSEYPNTSYENQLIMAYQAKPVLTGEVYNYNKVFTDSASSMISLGNNEIAMQTAGPDTTYANFLKRISISAGKISLGVQQYFVGTASDDSRGSFSPLTTPVLLSFVNTSTQVQTARLLERLGENKILSVECSIRIGVSATSETTLKVYGMSEASGYTLVMPKSSSTAQRIKTKRVRIPLNDDGILTLSLSSQCSLLELRVVGIWK